MTWWSRLLKSGSRKPSRSPSDLPYYTALEPSHPGKVRRDFSELENSPEIDRLRAEFESELLSLPRLPAEDEPLLTSLVIAPSGVFTATLPNSTPCLLIFSTPLRAAEYARVHAGSLQLSYMSSTPKEFVQMMGDLRSRGNIQSFALDVCPHCMTFTVLNTNSILTPAAVVKIWAIHKSGELARESVYFASAQAAARRGDFQEAKEVALEAIQHVTTDSTRLHLLLGKIALSLKEKDVFGEAQAFLEFLRATPSARELLAAAETGDIRY